jgi:hypothetical protein
MPYYGQRNRVLKYLIWVEFMIPGSQIKPGKAFLGSKVALEVRKLLTLDAIPGLT